MNDRQNRDTDEPVEPKPKARPSMNEKDTAEERQYDDKARENLPEGRRNESRE